MFDRDLCCRQLRYSGMMETIRIRRAGYPIRHTFHEFVDRYRFLIAGCPPAHKIQDCRAATSRICQAVLGKADYQLGRTKVFLKDAQDLFLEQERDRVLTRKILVLQRCIRGWYHRRRFLKMRAAAVVIQKNFRAYNGKRKYQQMRTGYMRLQALIRSRILSHKFKHLRGHIVRLQARCRGALVRRNYDKKMWAVVKIQAHVRRMIAQKKYRKLRVCLLNATFNSDSGSNLIFISRWNIELSGTRKRKCGAWRKSTERRRAGRWRRRSTRTSSRNTSRKSTRRLSARRRCSTKRGRGT